MNRLIAIAAALAVLGLAAALLTGCAAADRAASERAAAEARRQEAAADQERAKAEAYATKKEAQTEAKKADAAILEAQRQGLAERVTAMMPIIGTIGMVIVAMLVFALMWRSYSTRPAYQPPQAYQPPRPQLPRPEIHLHIEAPAPGQSRREFYQGLPATINRALTVVDGQVTIYKEGEY